MTKKFLLKGLNCANCLNKIERDISKINGVDMVTINFVTTKLTLEANEDLIDAMIPNIQKIINKYESGVTLVSI